MCQQGCCAERNELHLPPPVLLKRIKITRPAASPAKVWGGDLAESPLGMGPAPAGKAAFPVVGPRFSRIAQDICHLCGARTAHLEQCTSLRRCPLAVQMLGTDLAMPHQLGDQAAPSLPTCSCPPPATSCTCCAKKEADGPPSIAAKRLIRKPGPASWIWEAALGWQACGPHRLQQVTALQGFSGKSFPASPGDAARHCICWSLLCTKQAPTNALQPLTLWPESCPCHGVTPRL